LLPLPLHTSLYALATCMTMAGGALALAWRNRPGVRTALFAGIVMGTAIAAKYNIGAALAGAIAIVFLSARSVSVFRRLAHVSVAFGAAATVVWVTLLPTLAAGAGRDMLACCFGSKAAYVRVAGINFFAGFR